MSTLKSGDDAFCAGEPHGSVEGLPIRGGYIFSATGIMQGRVLGPDRGIVKTGGHRVRQRDLAIFVLQEIRIGALQHARRSAIEARGATVVAVSMQNAANSHKSTRENGLRFPILVDTGGGVAAQFGLRYDVSPRDLALYKQLGNDLSLINGEGSGALPMPGAYLLGQDGIGWIVSGILTGSQATNAGL